MRVLLDTNIIIYRENSKALNYSVWHLFRWLDKLKFEKFIHPLSKEEIMQYRNANPAESMMLRLDAYEELKTIAPLAPEIEQTFSSIDKDKNDCVDTALLNEVFSGRVDLLITEDKKLRKKARLINLQNKVWSINAFISYATNANPNLIEYKMLAVKKVIIGDIDINNKFFNSLRDAYLNFNEWFAKKCNEEAYICQDDKGDILGFLYMKTEDEYENYSDMEPSFSPKKRLKVGTFKVDATGFRLGERFVKIIFDNALERNVDEIYITLFENRSELQMLSELLNRWGFQKHGVKRSTGETVMTKQMKEYNPNLTVKGNFPNLQYGRQKFILPIYPKYHTALIPDSILKNENEDDFLEKTPYRYALQKVYISFSRERNIYPGDIIIFYRTGDRGRAGYTGVLSSIAIVDEVLSGFESKEEYLGHCQNRSIFTKEELESFWHKYGANQIILKFIFVKSFNKRPILKTLWDNQIISFPDGPRPFTKITDNEFNFIVEEAETNLSRYWR